MKNQEFQLEELENAAVKKSNNAKRIAAISGAIVGGGAAGAAGATILNNGSHENEDTLTAEDLDKVAEGGSSQVTSGGNTEGDNTGGGSTGGGVVAGPAPEPDPEVTFDKTTHIYLDDELYATSVQGTIDGKSFEMVDYDNDGKADVVAYDENGDGIYQDNEISATYGYGPSMNVPTSNHEDEFFTTNPEGPIEPEPDPYDPWDDDKEDGIKDKDGFGEKDDAEEIKNDFEDEKTGETYTNDYADNNQDYNNDAELGNMAYAETDAEDYSDMAENDYADESSVEAYSDDLADSNQEYDNDVNMDYTAEVETETEEYSDMAANEMEEDTYEDTVDDSFDVV